MANFLNLNIETDMFVSPWGSKPGERIFLHSGNAYGIQYLIVSYDGHPNVYIENVCEWDSYQEANDVCSVAYPPVEFTFISEEKNWGQFEPGKVLGWDYAFEKYHKKELTFNDIMLHISEMCYIISREKEEADEEDEILLVNCLPYDLTIIKHDGSSKKIKKEISNPFEAVEEYDEEYNEITENWDQIEPSKYHINDGIKIEDGFTPRIHFKGRPYSDNVLFIVDPITRVAMKHFSNIDVASPLNLHRNKDGSFICEGLIK